MANHKKRREATSARSAEVRRQEAKRALDLKLKDLPAFNALDQKSWDEIHAHMQQFHQHPDLIERWARLLQYELSKGWSVEEIALPALTEANYGVAPSEAFVAFAVPVLHQTWGDREPADALVHWLTMRTHP